jgi:hypothetical protein
MRDDYEPSRREPLQLPVDCSRAAPREADQLRTLEAAIRLSEKKPENSLLDRREEG